MRRPRWPEPSQIWRGGAWRGLRMLVCKTHQGNHRDRACWGIWESRGNLHECVRIWNVHSSVQDSNLEIQLTISCNISGIIRWSSSHGQLTSKVDNALRLDC